jgi:deoxyribodipyrimidine photo-lyase
MIDKINIFWFRRDLRLQDNAGLYHALKGKYPVLPLFIFDTQILDKLEDRADARVDFIHQTLTTLKSELKAIDSTLLVKHGDPKAIWQSLLNDYVIDTVYTNHDYEPYAQARDHSIQQLLQSYHIDFKSFKDHIIFEKNEIVKDDGKPYSIFTPYSKKWKALLETKMSIYKGENISFYLLPYPTEKYFHHFLKTDSDEMPTLGNLGFQKSKISFPSKTVTRGLIKNYDKTRDFPALDGTSRLGIHFRFGTISIREKALNTLKINEIYLNELIWRDFYAMILYQFPQVVKGAFRPDYDRIEWLNDDKMFEKWCEGKTGYPLVDAGMRELNATGYMHNRVRMVVASFLTKHLLIDWRLGELYFANKLLDFDLASNNGGWQWAAGCGTDAAPYFRIFNPASQQEKFDKNAVYIRKWIPEWGTNAYPKPIVEHTMARERCLKTYKAALEK